MIPGPGRVLAGVVGLVAVLAFVAVLVTVAGGPTDYDPDSPEGVVQAYVEAVVDGDHREAAALLAEESPCGLDDLDEWFFDADVRVVLREVRIEGDDADVAVSIAESPAGSVFAGAERFRRHTFRLVGGPGQWQVSGTPWPMVECGRGGPR